MVERICKLPKKSPPRHVHLPARAASWPPMEAALFVLSGGAFDPSEPRPEPEDRQDMISVVCPTNERRHCFHPLLYECFMSQRYANKELIVVDTGSQKSQFLVKMAKQNPRLIYRFYEVEDFHENMPEDKKRDAWTIGLKRNICCCLARGSAIANFDDDDLYAPEYLSYMYPKLVEAAAQGGAGGGSLACGACDPPPAAVKLREWHLFDMSELQFRRLDVSSDKDVPALERHQWTYGWGFSYVFTRSAWELSPFPDVEFNEDFGFMLGLLAREAPVALARLGDHYGSIGLVAHTTHSLCTSGGEFNGAKRCGKKVIRPRAFEGRLMNMMIQVRKSLLTSLSE